VEQVLRVRNGNAAKRSGARAEARVEEGAGVRGDADAAGGHRKAAGDAGDLRGVARRGQAEFHTASMLTDERQAAGVVLIVEAELGATEPVGEVTRRETEVAVVMLQTVGVVIDNT